MVGLYAYFDFDGVREIMKTNPAYVSGMAGIYTGGLFRIIQSWGKRSKLKIENLEERIADLRIEKKIANYGKAEKSD